jgi:hypothetical protein
MVQQLKTAFVFSKRAWKWFSPIIVGLFILILLVLYSPLTKERDFDGLIGKIIDFTAIFSALLITFIISKAFQIRQEKNQLIKEALPLANKITYLRSIANILVNSRFFNEVMKNNADTKFPNYTKIEYRGNIEKFDVYNNVIYEESNERTDNYKYYGFDLYMGLKALILKKERSDDKILDTLSPRTDVWEQSELFQDKDRNKLYPLSLIDDWINTNSASFWEVDRAPSNFNINNITRANQDKVLELAVKIDKKYENRELTFDLLSEIGSDFVDYYIPHLREKMYKIESGLGFLLSRLLSILSIIIVSGVISPLILSSIELSISVKSFVIYLILSVLLITISYFLMILKTMLKSVIKVSSDQFIRFRW